MDAPYAQSITGNDSILLIASTAGGIPSFAWSEDGMVWQQSLVPAEQDGSYKFISGAACIGRDWVAVGAGGVLFVSEDNALTWERLPRVRNGAANFSGVVAAGEDFLGFGKESKPAPGGGFSEQTGILISRDLGRTWESRDVPGTSALLTGAVLGNVWILAGEDGLVCRSTDAGETWESYQLDSGGSFTSMAAGNGVFVLVGPQGLVLRSADQGETWEEIHPGGGEWIQGVAFGNGRFVLSGGTNAQAGSSSTDGRTWTPANGTGAWGTIGYGASGFLTVGGTYGRQTTVPSPPRILSLPDTLSGTSGRSFRRALRASVRGAGFVAAGLPPGITLDPVSGLLSGTPSTAGNFLTFFYATSDASGGDVRAVVFQIHDPEGNTGEALHWRSTPSGLVGLKFQPVAAGFSEGSFVGVGETETGSPVAVRSTNGTQWSVGVPPPEAPTTNGWGLLKAVAGSGQIWLAGGVRSNLWRSTDAGATWSLRPKLTTTPFDIEGLASNGATFVAVGKLARATGGEGAGLFVSQDFGVSWESVDVLSHPPLRSVTFNNGTWMAAGERGVILRSSNPLTTWELADSGTLNTLRAVHGSGDIFLAWGEAGLLLRSPDAGETWTPASAGSGFWPGTIASEQGLFVLSGGERAAGSTSRDGNVWQLPSSAGAYGVVVAGNSSFFSLNGNDVWFARGPWRPGVFPLTLPPSLEVGQSVQLQPKATGMPFSWRIQRLPRGLSFDPVTGRISGTIRQSGQLTIRIFARNSAGQSAPRTAVLNITNNFPPFAGSYAAGIPFSVPEDGSPLSRGGSLQLQINALGTFTGRLVLGRSIQNLRGEFDSGGRAEIAVDPSLAPSSTLLLSLPMTTPWDNSIACELQTPGESIEFSGERNLWNPRQNPATMFQGIYHALLSAEDWQEFGISFLTSSVAKNGNFRMTGKTADGAPLSASGFVFEDGRMHFRILQSRTAASLSGEFSPDYSTPERPFLGAARWTSDGWSRSPIDPLGFQFTLETRGCKYVAPAAGQLLWNLVAEDNNAAISTPEALTSVTILANNRVVLPPDSQFSSVVVQAARGTLGGRMLPSEAGRPTPLEGLVLSGPWNEAGGFSLSNGQSVPVLLRPAD